MSKKTKSVMFESYHMIDHIEEIPLDTTYKNYINKQDKKYVGRKAVNHSLKFIEVRGNVSWMCSKCFDTITTYVSFTSRTSITGDTNQILDTSPGFQITIDKCKHCRSKHPTLQMLDPFMADAISILNKKGFHTLSCSVGDISSPMYIHFSDLKILDYIPYILCPWEINLEDFRKRNEVVLVADCIYRGKYINSVDEHRYDCEKYEALNALYSFICGLPSLNPRYKMPQNMYETLHTSLFEVYKETKEEGD